MVAPQRKRGRITVEDRAWQQDAAQAMGTDPVAAVIELVTNSDDSYQRLGNVKNGRILIDITRRRRPSPTTLVVSDRAEGMTYAELEERLGGAGRETSGFDAAMPVRGMFGRGAKDLSHFGPVRWESKRNGEHTAFEIPNKGGASLDYTIEPLGVVSRRDHETEVRLTIGHSFRVPRHDTLLQRLPRHYALRPILRDREGRLVLLGQGEGREKDKLVYQEPRGRSLASGLRVPIEGYPDCFADVSLWEADETLEDGEPWEYWKHSLLVTSGRSAHEVFHDSALAREPNARYLGRLFGTADVPAINDLIREFESARRSGQEPSVQNPTELVRRDRRGLSTEHPFVTALHAALDGVLRPHVERLREQSEHSQGGVAPNLRRRLDAVGQLLGRYLEEENQTELPGTGMQGDLPEPGLTLVPPRCIALPGKAARTLVRYRPTGDTAYKSVEVLLDHGDTEMSTQTLELDPRDGYWSKTLTVDGRDAGARTEVLAVVGNDEATGTIEWEERETDEVEELQFERASYVVREGSERKLRLLGPIDLAAQDIRPEVSIAGDPGITMKSSAFVFGVDAKRNCAVCIITVTGRGVGARARVTARVGADEAKTALHVGSRGVSGLHIDFEDADPAYRSRLDHDEGTLWVNRAHPVVKRYLGARTDDTSAQDSVHFRTMLAELLVAAVVRYQLQERYQEPVDASVVFTAYQQDLERLLTRVSSALVPAEDLR